MDNRYCHCCSYVHDYFDDDEMNVSDTDRYPLIDI